MNMKKVSLMIVPEDGGGIKQLTVQPALFVLVSVFIFSIIVTGSFFIYHLFKENISLKNELYAKLAPELESANEELTQKKQQLLYMAERVDEITSNLENLASLDYKLRVLVNMNHPEDEPIGLGGPLETDSKGNSSQLISEINSRINTLETEADLRGKSLADLHDFLKSRKLLLACTPSIAPAKGWISSNFGARKSPFTDQKEFHNGLDISARKGTPILATADGVVIRSAKEAGFGNVVEISHGYGFKTLYAHNDKNLVKVNQKVKRGDTIALVGNTGRSTGNHLHYEVYFNNIRVNPKNYILNSIVLNE